MSRIVNLFVRDAPTEIELLPWLIRGESKLSDTNRLRFLGEVALAPGENFALLLTEKFERTFGLLEDVSLMGHALSVFQWTKDKEYNRGRRRQLREAFEAKTKGLSTIVLSPIEGEQWAKMLAERIDRLDRAGPVGHSHP